MLLGEKIKKLREERGMNLKQMGDLTESSGPHIRHIERRERKNVSLFTLCRIAKVFDMSLDELVRDTEFDLRKENDK